MKNIYESDKMRTCRQRDTHSGIQDRRYKRDAHSVHCTLCIATLYNIVHEYKQLSRTHTHECLYTHSRVYVYAPHS